MSSEASTAREDRLPCEEKKGGKARLIGRLSHVRVNGRTERRESSASQESRLRTCFGAEYSTSDASGGNAVSKVVFGPEAFNAAFCSTEQSTDNHKVLRAAI